MNTQIPVSRKNTAITLPEYTLPKKTLPAQIRILFIAPLFLLMAFLFAVAPAQADDSVIIVSSTAAQPVEVKGAEIDMYITERNVSVGIAKQTVDISTRKLLARLKNLKIADNDIQSYVLRINPYNKRQPGTNTMEHAGFDVSRKITIVIRDWAKIDTVLDDAIKLGVNQVSQIKPLYANETDVYNQALNMAYLSAKNKATLLAKQSGRKLGETLKIEETGRMPVLRAEAMMADSSSVSRQGRQEVTATLSVTFELKD